MKIYIFRSFIMTYISAKIFDFTKMLIQEFSSCDFDVITICIYLLLTDLEYH